MLPSPAGTAMLIMPDISLSRKASAVLLVLMMSIAFQPCDT